MVPRTKFSAHKFLIFLLIINALGALSETVRNFIPLETDYARKTDTIFLSDFSPSFRPWIAHTTKNYYVD